MFGLCRVAGEGNAVTHPPHDGRTMLEQLKAAGSGADVIEILGDVSAAKELAAYAKEPSVRMAVMLLAKPEPGLDVQARFKFLAFLAALSAVKPVRSIVDEFAPRALAEPVSEVASSLSQQEKALLAEWISGRNVGWVADFAVRMAVAESRNEKLCQAYMALFFSRASAVSHVIQRFTDEIGSLGMSPAPARALGKRNLCTALSRLAAKTPIPPGKNLAGLLRTFAMQEILQDSESYQSAEKAGVAISVSELLSVLVQRFQGLLLSEIPFEIVSFLEKEWVSPGDRKWKQSRKELFTQVEKLTTLFALNGVCATELVQKAKILEATTGSTEKMCRSILEQNDISSEEVAGWLARGGTVDGSGKTRPRESLSETEALSQVLLRANELMSLDLGQDPQTERAVRETLLVEINQFAAKKGLQLDCERNSVVSYDPIRQRATGAVLPRGRVRVLSPGVVRKAETGLFQVIQAIVEPDEQ